MVTVFVVYPILAQGLWSLLSVRVALKGVLRSEYNFGHNFHASLAIRSNGKPASSLSAKKLQKREFVLEF